MTGTPVFAVYISAISCSTVSDSGLKFSQYTEPAAPSAGASPPLAAEEPSGAVLEGAVLEGAVLAGVLLLPLLAQPPSRDKARTTQSASAQNFLLIFSPPKFESVGTLHRSVPTLPEL